jgi:hypothetical protein
MTFDNYVQAFKQSTLYRQYLQGGLAGHGLDRNELLLGMAQWFNDPTTLVAVVANYTFNNPLIVVLV